MNDTYQIEPLANAHCFCGENPYWDDQRQLVYWTDIDNGRLFRFDVRTGKWEKFYDGPKVGGFTLQADGTLLLFRVTDVARCDASGRAETVKEFVDEGTQRFNDVIADPEGRVFAGTIGKTKESGGVFRFDTDGRVTLLYRGTGTSNGMGFSPDLNKFYWTDTTARKTFVFDYDRASGNVANRQLFRAASDDEGKPDGLTIDTEGNVWQAFWNGYAMRKFSQTGELLETIKFPVARVSSVSFGGTDLHDCYVTTAGGADGADTADGTLYRVRVKATGRLEFRSRILLR